MLIIAGLSVIGAGLGFGSWWMMQRLKRKKAPPPAVEDPGTVEPAPEPQPEEPFEKQPVALLTEPLPQPVAPPPLPREGPDISGQLSAIERLLRDLAAAQATLLESDAPPADPRIDALTATLKSQEQRLDSLETHMTQGFDGLALVFREALDERGPAAGEAEADDDVERTERIAEALEARIADSLREAVAPHLSLLGEDLKRLTDAAAKAADPAPALDTLGQRIEAARVAMTEATRDLDARITEIAAARGGGVATPSPSAGLETDLALQPKVAALAKRRLSYIPSSDGGEAAGRTGTE